jgi:hypothetical protein
MDDIDLIFSGSSDPASMAAYQRAGGGQVVQDVTPWVEPTPTPSAQIAAVNPAVTTPGIMDLDAKQFQMVRSDGSIMDVRTGQIVSNGPGPSSNKETFDFAQGVIGTLAPVLGGIANTFLTTDAAKNIAKQKQQGYKPGLFGTTLPPDVRTPAPGLSTTAKVAIGAGILGGVYFLFFRKRGRR